jgi:hypothetical protein
MHKENAIKYPLCINGFKAKTINIRTTAGGTRFNLQQINELGLPREANILGLLMRVPNSSITSSNGNPLVDVSIFNNAYLSLKDRANSKNDINLLFSDYYLPNLAVFSEFVQPVPSQLIDWNQSFIRINPRVNAIDNSIFEIIVLYSDPCDNEKFPNRLIFRDGLEMSGKRLANFEVSLNATQKEYSLSNSDNVGIPTDAIILGFTTKNNAFPLYGTTGILTAALNSSYLTLKEGTCSIVDEFPAGIQAYNQIIESIKYFPIVPTDVLAMDWQQSKLVIKNNAGVTSDMVFQFGIVWW